MTERPINASADGEEDEDEDDEKKDFTIYLDNLDEDGQETVSVHVNGPGALRWAKEFDQSIMGSNWEGSDGDDFARTEISDSPTLVEDLEAEGYVLNTDNYSPPDAEEGDAREPEGR
jgi:hypothetical protein